MPLELLRVEFALPAFALVLARVAGLTLGAPIFASSQIPGLIKVLVVVALSLVAFPIVHATLPAALTLPQALVGMVGEFILGELMGLSAGAALFAAQMAGKIVSYQSGFTLGQVVNPLFDEEFSVIDQLYFFAAFMVFLAVGGHLILVSVLLDSFRLVPPMAWVSDVSLAEFLRGLLENCFDVALRLAGPVMLALLLASIVMGFLAKTMPQMNVLSVGFAAKIAVALVVAAISLGASEGLLVRSIGDGFADLRGLLDHVSGVIAHGT